MSFFRTIAVVTSLLILGGNLGFAAGDDLVRKAGSLRDLRNVTADKWSLVGSNIIVEGHVHVPYGPYDLYADRAIVNVESKDVEAEGNVRLYNRRIESAKLTLDQLARLQNAPDTVVRVDKHITTPDGRHLVQATAFYVGDSLTAKRLAGNLSTGFFSFEDAHCRFKDFAAKAKRGIRRPDGQFDIKDAELSSCEYLKEDHSHFSIAASSAKIYPHQTNVIGAEDYNYDYAEHSAVLDNALFKVYGIPIFYLPWAYKPKDESPGLFSFTVGSSSDWGYFINASKRFVLNEYPYVEGELLLDYFTRRGIGYGANFNIATENSKTELFGYGIYDLQPYRSNDAEYGRFKIPHFRYDLRAVNVTHLTDRLDFRGRVEFMSDIYMQYDYFNDNFDANTEPATYASFEYQFDRFSTALYAKVRANDFFTTVERLPEFRLDMPRQELFGTGIYYQGEHSIDYLTMKYREDSMNGISKIHGVMDDYSAFRLDTLNFLYYPMRFLDAINFIPRAGVRMTVYDHTSTTPVTEENLASAFYANIPETNRFPSYLPGTRNYTEGSGTARFIGEFGAEASTKFYSSWQNVRNGFLRLDGLRHVFVPYINYTYMTNPTTDRDNLYYFDDIDRLQKQHFVRFGAINRLQTRALDRPDTIRTFLTMENYWDYHIEQQDGLSHIGDFCTRLTAEPFKGLQIGTFFSINASGEDNYRAPSKKLDREVERKGISGTWLNRWELSLRYEPVQDFVARVRFVYQDGYQTQSAYSMGSTLDELETGSAFDRFYLGRAQQLVVGFSIPLTPDRNTKLAYEIFYDFEAGFIRSQKVALSHQFHCWMFSIQASQRRDYDEYGGTSNRLSLGITASLVKPSTPLRRITSSVLDGYADAPPTAKEI
ncbi:MAG: hypothetical protein PHS41_01955 [Victivallaceae bacterium]|nr:hypothetical protein [Victivallaceae bacterium]